MRLLIGFLKRIEMAQQRSHASGKLRQCMGGRQR